MKRLSGVVFALSLAACGREAATGSAQPAAPGPAGNWAGRWTGPEGLFLLIEDAGGGAYRLTLKDNLDSQAKYEAEAVEGGLAFLRAGGTVVIRKGPGSETGFKWLADKQDCVILVAGREGYCRD